MNNAQAMEIHKRGGVDSSYDLYVDVPDEEDVILRILELLRGTSLVNIHINEENQWKIFTGSYKFHLKNAQDLERAESPHNRKHRLHSRCQIRRKSW